MKVFHEERILPGVAGSIAAFQATDLASRLMQPAIDGRPYRFFC
jgi:hypothetical protein